MGRLKCVAACCPSRLLNCAAWLVVPCRAHQSPPMPTSCLDAQKVTQPTCDSFFGRLVGWSALQIIFPNPFHLINSLTATQWTCLFHALCDPQPADLVSMVGRGPPLAGPQLGPHGPNRTNRHTNANRTMSPQNYRRPIRHVEFSFGEYCCLQS